MYIGNTVQNQGFTPQVDFFSGNASTTAFTLSRPVASTYQMIVVVANVTQNPGSAYTVNGNTITFASAPPNGTNNIWVEYTSLITQVIAPSPGTVGTAQLQNNLALTGATNSGQWTAANMPTGSVIQISQGSYAVQSSTTSTSPVTTNVTASITPQFSTSKILVITSLMGIYQSTTTNHPYAAQFIYRNGSSIVEFDHISGYNNSGTIASGSSGGGFCWLDSPASTSALTYTIYISVSGTSTGSIAWCNDNKSSTITLMEIR